MPPKTASIDELKEPKKKSKETIAMENAVDAVEEQFLNPMFHNQTVNLKDMEIPFKGASFLLPMPLSANRISRTVRKGNGIMHIKSPAAILWTEKLQNLLKEMGFEPTNRLLGFRILIYGLATNADTDNRTKLLKDATQGVIIENDKDYDDERVINMRTMPKSGSFIRMFVWYHDPTLIEVF